MGARWKKNLSTLVYVYCSLSLAIPEQWCRNKTNSGYAGWFQHLLPPPKKNQLLNPGETKKPIKYAMTQKKQTFWKADSIILLWQKRPNSKSTKRKKRFILSSSNSVWNNTCLGLFVSEVERFFCCKTPIFGATKINKKIQSFQSPHHKQVFFFVFLHLGPGPNWHAKSGHQILRCF